MEVYTFEIHVGLGGMGFEVQIPKHRGKECRKDSRPMFVATCTCMAAVEMFKGYKQDLLRPIITNSPW